MAELVITAQGKKELEERSLPIHILGKEEAIKVFEEWKQKSDKIEY